MYRFHCVEAAFLELLDVTGVDSSPFQLFQGERTGGLGFSGKGRSRTLSVISVVLSCSCMGDVGGGLWGEGEK